MANVKLAENCDFVLLGNLNVNLLAHCRGHKKEKQELELHAHAGSHSAH